MSGRSLIGRRAEAAVLADLMIGAGEYRHAFVVGEAGVGKSRLLEATCDAVSETGVTVLTGACLPLSESLPLMPVVDVVRAVASSDGGALLDDALSRCPEFVREPIERLLTAAPLGAQHEAGAGTAHRQQTFEAVRQLLEATARLRRLTVVVEDVHWADSSTVDLLEYLLAPNHGCGVPIVVSYRDHPSVEGGSAADAMLDQAIRHAGVLRLALAPFTADEVRAQIETLTGEPADPAFTAAVYRRSQGNPFFAEQLVAHLSGLDDDAGISMPAGLAELLLTRVAGLTTPAADLLAALAVAQRPIGADDLATICRLSAIEVRDGLSRLRRRGLLRPHDEGYQLRHHLLAQAVSDDLLIPQRRELHAAIGDVLAGWPDDRFAAEAAEHYQRAGEAEKELTARLRAGAYAQEAFAWPDAERHWRRSLACYGPVVPRPDDSQDIWTIYSGLHLALRARGRGDEALPLAEEAYAKLLDHSDGLQRADLCRRLGNLRGERTSDAGMPLLDAALAACAGLPPSRIELTTLLDKETALRNTGRIAEAEKLLDRLATVADQIDDKNAQIEIIGIRAWHRMHAGDDTEALARIHEMLATGTEARGVRTPPYVGMTATDVLLKLGRLDEVAAAGRRPLEVSEARGLADHISTWLLRWNMADALIELGSTAEAASLLDPVATAPLTQTTMWGSVAAAHLMLLDDALDAAERAWQPLDRFQFSSINFRTEYEQRRCELLVWQGDDETAFDRAVTSLEAAHDNDESAFTGILLVLALRACADRAAAARARRDDALLADAVARADRLVALHAGMQTDPLVRGPARVTGDALRASWDAELARVHGRDTAANWASAAAAWTELARPHRIAYALLRQAEAALRERGRSADLPDLLRRAAELAHTHVPLHRLVSDVAVRARVDLTRAPTGPEPPASARATPFGLTERELAVLRLVAEGRSNIEIGAALYISPKTASVHVSNILRKLDAATRAHAAAVAQRAGLLDEA